LSLVPVIREPADAAGDLNLALLGVLTGKTSSWAYQMAMVVVASAIFKQYQAGFYGLSTAGNVILFIAVSIIIFPLMRYFNRKELDL
jgi:uncharacterized membrane protein